MKTDTYRLITWYEHSWEYLQNNIDYINALNELDLAAQEGFKPIGQPTCAFVQQEEGMKIFFTQAFYREYGKVKHKTVKSKKYKLITPHTKKGKEAIIKETKKTLKALTRKAKKK